MFIAEYVENLSDQVAGTGQDARRTNIPKWPGFSAGFDDDGGAHHPVPLFKVVFIEGVQTAFSYVAQFQSGGATTPDVGHGGK
ncbi:MAG: hypothetical protein ABI873_16635 [Marmoricola sp.]